MPNFYLTSNPTLFEDFDIFKIDGTKANTLRNFYEQMAKALNFPEYFGFNLDSLDEMLNDLSWLKEEKVLVYISNSEHFIEKERNPEKLPTLLDLLDATCEDWKWADDEGEFPKKELIFAFSPSKRMEQFFQNKEISFEVR